MSKYSLISMLCLSLLVVGCDHYTTKMVAMEQPTSDFDSIAPAAGGEMTFSGYLSKEYYQLALQEQNVHYDYPAAKKYFTKAEQLSNNQLVLLDEVSDYKIEYASEKRELSLARQQLDMALREYSIPENRYALAKAHSRFDCWLDEAEEEKEFSSCKVEYQQAMNSLIEPYTYYTEDDYFNDVFDLGL